MANVSEFVREVKQEAGKVTWPTKKEVSLSTLMVFVMVFIMSIFFLMVDGVLGWVVQKVLGLAG